MMSAMKITAEQAARFARLVLAGIGREYPNKLDHVLNGPECVRSPRELHPAFYGCFDWHSAVHGHWLLAKVLRLFPHGVESDAIRAVLDRHLTPENIAAEAAYLSRPNSGSFERPYGWAWLLKLAEELRRAETASWGESLAPLTDAIVRRYQDFLPRMGYAVRSGVHSNTAFGLAFAHDFAATAGDEALRELVEETARRLFAADRDAPVKWEPSGADFFSPSLMQADLMRRVLGPEPFVAWLEGFLPRLGTGDAASMLAPARVSDRGDLQIVHLDGLNLSRAWNMRNVALALPAGHAARGPLERCATEHIAAALPHIDSGSYAGEHWLATFAMLALTGER